MNASDFKVQSLPDRIADHVVVLIAQGTLQPGQRLFEKELCDTLGVSRIPVREALRLLQAQGVVHTEPNRGTFVTELGSEETAELLELRLGVERIALRRLLERLPQERGLLTALDSNMEEMRNAALIGDRLAFCRADLNFHSTLVELSGSPMLRPMWSLLARGILVFLMNERNVAIDFEQSIRDHIYLLELLTNGSASAVDREIDRHIHSHVQLPKRGA